MPNSLKKQKASLTARFFNSFFPKKHSKNSFKMIDYVKIYFEKIDIKKILSNKELNFCGHYSKTTGEINDNILIADYHFCKITIKNAKSQNPKIFFTGSIHKLWNDLNEIKAPNYNNKKRYKGFNGNLLTLNNIIKIRKHLEKLFYCKSKQMTFQNIEFGINAILNFNPKLYLKGLLYHKNISFEFSHSENYAQAKHSNLILKIYNKTFQYRMPENVLRVEVKIKKMNEIKNLNIKNFSDIEINTLKGVQKMLIKRFDEIIHYDYTIDNRELTKTKKDSLKNYSNPRYWFEDLKPIHRDRHKKRLKELTQFYSNNIQIKIKKEILKKCVTINHT